MKVSKKSGLRAFQLADWALTSVDYEAVINSKIKRNKKQGMEMRPPTILRNAIVSLLAWHTAGREHRVIQLPIADPLILEHVYRCGEVLNFDGRFYQLCVIKQVDDNARPKLLPRLTMVRLDHPSCRITAI